MHTSFEDISEKHGHIYRMDENGNWIWEHPRKPAHLPWGPVWAIALAAAAPVAFCLTLVLLS
jgi:hypothetical protein